MALVDSKSARLLLHSEMKDDLELSDSDDCSTDEEGGFSLPSFAKGSPQREDFLLNGNCEPEKDFDYHKMYNIESRNYQTELLKLAKEENIIICLPTGTGKTYIALKLTESMLPEAIENKKKIVFLANNVPLVHQQAKYFSANLVSTAMQDDKYVRAISGDLNVDIWKQDQWDDVMAKYHILVMSTQILLDAITKAYVKWSEIALLILDECHHAQKNHPMAELMKNYGERQANGATDLPKVLGLTATIIKGQSKEEQIPKDISDIETLLCCKAVTHRNYEEVLKHSTDSIMTPMMFTLNYSIEDPTCFDIVSFVAFLSRLPKSFVSDEEISLIESVKHPSLTSEEQLYNKDKGIAKTLKSFLLDLLKTYEELGPYCCKLAATIKLVHLLQWIRQLDDMSLCQMESENNFQGQKNGVALLLYNAQTILLQFIKKLENKLAIAASENEEGSSEAFVVRHCISNKLKCLLAILGSKRNVQDETDKLCGLVFCERRITAQVLRWYLQIAAQHCPDLDFIKPELMVGHSTIVQNTDVARFNAKKQTAILRRFHAKELNVLVATQVVEEGLNVPSCNLVIRFDTIQTYPSFVQSMGRARKKGAQCYALIEESVRQKEQEKISSYTRYNRRLAIELEQNAIHIGEGNDDKAVATFDVPIPPFCPSNDPDGPVITAADAISIVHRYCNALSCDKIAALVPTAFWEGSKDSNGKPRFKAYVILPILSPIRHAVEGKWMSDKTLAKRSGFLEVCKLLYENNELNENLLPRPRSIDSYKCEFLDSLAREHDVEKSITEGKVGTRKRVQQYMKEVPQVIRESDILANRPLFVYKVGIEMKTFIREVDFKQLYDFDTQSLYYGIVTLADIGDLPPFQLLANYGSFQVKIERCEFNGKPFASLTEAEIATLETFQKFLVESVYRIKNPVLVSNAKHSVLIAPLRNCGEDGYQIDWRLVSALNNFNERSLLCKPDEKVRTIMEFDPERYQNSIIVPWYKEDEEPELLCTLNILPGTNAQTEFDEPKKFPTFEAYFKKRYQVDLHHPDFPLIQCKQVGNQLNFLNAKTDGKSLRKDMQRSLLKMIPELTNIHSLPASLYVQGRLLPSVLHRLNRLLLAKQLQQSVASYFNWDVNPGPNSESQRTELRLTTDNLNLTVVELPLQERMKQITLQMPKREGTLLKKSKDDLFFVEDLNPLKIPWEALAKSPTIVDLRRTSNKTRDTKFALPEPPVCKSNFGYELPTLASINFPSFDKRTDFQTENGPNINTIMEALTLSNAQDSTSLEKLEVMGDSVLKVVASLHIFRSFPQWDEGKMTLLRMKLISNLHLYQMGKKHNLGEKLSGSIFIPDLNWLPCGFSVPSQIEKFMLSQKNINYDIFKSIPSSVLADAGPDEYKKLIFSESASGSKTSNKQITHTTLTHSKIGDKSIADAMEAIIGAYYINGGLDSAFRIMEFLGLKGPLEDGSAIFYSREATLSPPKENFAYLKKPASQNIIPLLKDLEDILNYKFTNSWLAVEALTHPTYMGNRVTPCYERLEYVGDALLDFLVTNYIFQNTSITDPGQITDLRSALVNNVTFASLSVRYGFHTFLKYDSELLGNYIMQFAQYQDENDHVVSDPYQLFSDFDCPTVKEIEVPKVLGDIFESIAGAVFVDSGMSIDTVWKVFYRLMKNELELFSKSIPKSPLRMLYEQFPRQVKFRKLTTSDSVNSNRKEHCAAKFQAVSLKAPCFDHFVLGVGTTIKQAKQAAAKYVIRTLKSQNLMI